MVAKIDQLLRAFPSEVEDAIVKMADGRPILFVGYAARDPDLPPSGVFKSDYRLIQFGLAARAGSTPDLLSKADRELSDFPEQRFYVSHLLLDRIDGSKPEYVEKIVDAAARAAEEAAIAAFFSVLHHAVQRHVGRLPALLTRRIGGKSPGKWTDLTAALGFDCVTMVCKHRREV